MKTVSQVWFFTWLFFQGPRKPPKVFLIGSPLHDAALRFDSLLHAAEVKWWKIWLSTKQCNRVIFCKINDMTPASWCSGEIRLPAASCRGKIWHPAAWYSGESNLNWNNSINFKSKLGKFSVWIRDPGGYKRWEKQRSKIPCYSTVP
jgi:hypothetical protein